MRRVYTHFTCDMPECRGSWDGPGVDLDVDFLPPGWASIGTVTGRGGPNEISRINVAIACQDCVGKLHSTFGAGRDR